MKLEDLSKQIEKIPGFPPVHLWNPDLCEGVKFNIDRNGEWFYQNSPLKKESLNLLVPRSKKNKKSKFKITIFKSLKIDSIINLYNCKFYFFLRIKINLLH